MIFYLTLGNLSWLSSSNGSPTFSTKCHCTVNLITAVRAEHLLFLFLCLILSSSYFSDIGGGGKRKPPPMHRMRRLREPGKIHRRRRNCTRAASSSRVFPVKFLRLPSDASHGRRGGGRGATALPIGHAGRVTLPVATSATLPRGKSVCRGDPGFAPFRVGGNSIPKIRPASGMT